MKTPTFEAEIAHNRSLETIEKPQVHELATEKAALQIRERGCYVTKGELYSPTLDEIIPVLYSDPDITEPKLTATHPMSPVGPYDGIGGQHGFPRWADYKSFPAEIDIDTKKHMAFQAKRSDEGVSLVNNFELEDSCLLSEITIQNPGSIPERTSLGEHLYFSLAGEEFSGLTIGGLSLDQLLGENAESNIKEGEPIYWEGFDGLAVIKFPAGYNVILSTTTEGAPHDSLGMLVWHRPGTESICFEPTIGFDPEHGGDNLQIDPFQSVVLATRIEVL